MTFVHKQYVPELFRKPESLEFVHVQGIEVIPGLSVHKATYYPKTWLITHVNSGLRLGTYSRRKDAIEFCEKLNGLTDWTQDAKTLQTNGAYEKFKALSDLEKISRLYKPMEVK